MLEVTPCDGDSLETALLMGDFDYIFPKNNPYSEDMRMLLTSEIPDGTLYLDVDIQC